MSAEVTATEVLLLAAGFGKRLQSVAGGLPKPLVSFCGKPLIEWNLELLRRSGFQRAFVNLHYQAEAIENFLGDGSRWGLKLRCVREDPILETGGAISNIRDAIGKASLLTLNSDAIFQPEFSLAPFVARHLRERKAAEATLLLRPDPAARDYGAIGIEAQGTVVSFLGVPYSNTPPVEELMYTGVQILAPSLLEKLPAAGTVYSITRDFYPQYLAQGGALRSEIYHGFFSDVGTPERLAAASKEYQRLVTHKSENS